MAKGIDASEIARLAGVSRATVSRVINDYAYVKPATRERVLKIVDKYSYSPHFSAQILAGKRSNTIGFFFVTAEGANKSRLEDTHINFMIRRVIHTAMAAGYYVLVSQASDTANPSVMKRIGDMFAQSRIDGGIFVGFPNGCGLIEELVERGFPIGIFDQYLPGKVEPNRIVVRLDHSRLAEVIKYAVSLGHRKILYTGAEMKIRTGVDNFCIFRETITRLGLEVNENYILDAKNLSGDAAAETLKRFLDLNLPLPDCIVCDNDVMAFGVIEVLRGKNIKIPEEVSVVGSDDILVSRFIDPPLATVRYDFDTMLETLTSKVIGCVESPFEEHYEGVWPGEIVPRLSCRAPARELAR